MPSQLRTRLGTVFSDEPSTRVMAGSGNWPGGFGGFMNEVRSVIVHLTAGWPPREKVEEFVKQYIGPPANVATRKKAGIGPQYFVVGDGTVFQTIDVQRLTWHGNDPYNNWAIGVETANLGEVAPPQFPVPTNIKFDNRWRALGPDAHLNASDVPGRKLWISLHHFGEVVVSWWTTPTYNGPARAPVGNQPLMLFSEAQYRSWALLGRYFAELFDVPRNFALLPHSLRSSIVDDSSFFRRIILADEQFPVMLRALAAYTIEEAHFETANAATLEARYDAAVRARHVPAQRDERRNLIWSDLFNVYRGFHGHGFSGAPKLVGKEQPAGSGNFVLVNGDHDCPGPLFDWHRFAREVWDWWWFPFDLTDNLAAASLVQRPERHANGTTPLVEYYFEATDFDAKERAYSRLTTGGPRATHGIFDDISSPSTFLLPPRVPIYAPANGVLIAARFPDPRHAVSLAFVLVRHEIFHEPDTLMIDIDGGGSAPAHPGRIDYNAPPAYFYSLIIHLEQPQDMSFTEVNDANPEWLNRVLIRKKECDLGIAFYDNDPAHGGIPQAQWDSRPPPAGTRPTLLEGWRRDQGLLQTFLDTLRNGDIALATPLSFMPQATPIRIILGDFLGESGSIRRVGDVFTHGIGMEVFASGFVPPTFHSHMSESGWSLTAGAQEPASVFYQSEWSKTPTPAERERLLGIGVNPDLVPWWPVVAQAVNLDPTLPPVARLNREGWAFHVRPIDFMRWINGVTWTSEWPKYQVKDANGVDVPKPARPRSRRR